MKRSPMKRSRAKPWRPSEEGLRFWHTRRLEVIARDGWCICGAVGTDVAHIRALGIGRSRYNPDEPLNALSNLRLLCRACHANEEAGRTERPRR